ncbi:MAG: hypothetical protein NZZ41_00320 [Candidatus Dojkabacteria bacterium]|nr:hypothetical protein [Candidatus Dojkabacteria bacterium]
MGNLFKFKPKFNVDYLKNIVLDYTKNFEWLKWKDEDWYQYIQIMENKDYVLNSDLNKEIDYYLNFFGVTPTKCRISRTLNKKGEIWPSKRGWHRDPPISKEIRLLIPISGCENTGIEFANSPPEKIEYGYVYFFNTQIYHRIWCDSCDVERICLLICFENNFKGNINFYKKYFNKL